MFRRVLQRQDRQLTYRLSTAGRPGPYGSPPGYDDDTQRRKVSRGAFSGFRHRICRMSGPFPWEAVECGTDLLQLKSFEKGCAGGGVGGPVRVTMTVIPSVS
jgi:hypothetical protein